MPPDENRVAVPGKRLADLRTALKAAGLAGFIVPHADRNQSEYLPPSAEHLAWLTGFTGSAGMAVVLTDTAAIFVDGRYTLQVRGQVDTAAFTPVHLVENPPHKWLSGVLKMGDRIGYDHWLLTVAEVRRFAEVCKAADAVLVAVEGNPLDSVWSDRPSPPQGAVTMQPVEFAGEEASAKIARLQQTLAEKKADAAVLGQGDSIAWTFNIRGSDIAHNPVPLAFAILPAAGKPELFIEGRKLSNAVRAELAELADLREPDALQGALAGLGERKARVLLDPQTTAEAIAAAIRDSGGTLVEGADPVTLPKARKNDTELAGARRAAIRDGAAMVRFLSWLDEAGPTGTVDEASAAEKLAAFRAETARQDGSALADLSFDTISGSGPNGAIVHYRVNAATARRLAPPTLYLIDSGGQYRDGTTDITRTVAIGEPTAEMRDRFTRVLKGHIAIATVRFPVGTNGAQLDALARLSLWNAGLDFDHGTGHGIGAFLNVHEGPAGFSKRNQVPFEPGMIISNEPGYYKTSEYGVRIENLMIVKPPAPVPGGEREMLSFETITLCPIDRRLIEPSLLTQGEIAWVDSYHAGLAAPLARLLNEREKAWLIAATRPIGDRKA